jgi:hypothetical protein
MKTSLLHFIILSAGLIALTSCAGGGGGIPVDEKLARVHVIPIKEAKAYTNSFETGRADLAKKIGDTAYLVDTFNLPNAEMFNRHAIALLLNQEGAEGIRIYFGRDAKGQVRLVLLPVDKEGKNIIRKLIPNNTVSIPGISPAYAQEEGEAIENGQRCPTMCDNSW